MLRFSRPLIFLIQTESTMTRNPPVLMIDLQSLFGQLQVHRQINMLLKFPARMINHLHGGSTPVDLSGNARLVYQVIGECITQDIRLIALAKLCIAHGDGTFILTLFLILFPL